MICRCGSEFTWQDGLIIGVSCGGSLPGPLIAGWYDLRKKERPGSKQYPGSLAVRYPLQILCCIFDQAFTALLSGI